MRVILHVKVAIVDKHIVAVQKVLHIIPLGSHEVIEHTVVHVAALAVEAQVSHMDGLPCCVILQVDSVVVLLRRKLTNTSVVVVGASHS